MSQRAFQSETGRLRRRRSGLELVGDSDAKAELMALIASARERSLTARAALDWAAHVGVKVACVSPRKGRPGKTLGYYNPSYRGIVIYTAGQSPGALVHSLVHEIRHMWQDDKGLLENVPVADFERYYRHDPAQLVARQALYEADAYAHGRLAEIEFTLRQPLADPATYLANSFKQWFKPHISIGYHLSMVRSAKRYLPTPKDQQRKAFLRRSFNLHAKPPRPCGIDLSNNRDILRLGNSFAGTNYLARLMRESPEFLSRALSPSQLFIEAFNTKRLSPHIATIVKAHKREKLQYRKKRYPLPG